MLSQYHLLCDCAEHGQIETAMQSNLQLKFIIRSNINITIYSDHMRIEASRAFLVLNTCSGKDEEMELNRTRQERRRRVCVCVLSNLNTHDYQSNLAEAHMFDCQSLLFIRITSISL